MELIRTLRDRHNASKLSDIQKNAERVITLDDFDGSVYIAYNGVPFVPVEETWTSKEIIEKLTELRNNYINAMMKDFKIPRMALV